MTTEAILKVVVCGIGNEYRSDDGAGVIVAREVANVAPEITFVGPFGEPLDLLGAWDDADLAVIVDATRSGMAPGTLQILDVSNADLSVGDSVGPARSSTHGLGVIDTLRLARAVGSDPRRVVIIGIEGQSFQPGLGLCAPVAHSVNEAVALVRGLVAELA